MHDLEGRVVDRRRLAGGSVAEVERWTLDDGSSLVAKIDRGRGGGLLIEARMLEDLGRRGALAVPTVIAVDAGLLLVSDLGGRPGARGRAEEEAARALAALHEIEGPAFGYDYDTLIGGLPQANDYDPSWPRFYGDRRLGAMAAEARAAGRLPDEIAGRVDRLRGRLDRELDHRPLPVLVHGDVWSGNVLSEGDELRGFVDPALHYADAEVELAFIELFGTFSRRFHEVYDALHPPRPGDRARRLAVLQVQPLLVHVRLFGAAYHQALDQLLRRLLA
ncbi:MAG: fructosamine kinase family protein [Planctomycetes bacterium]|nr:fructosamine kinase family protein [Planctomycetota bacterium]